ncbi:MAG: GNAT family N-acetyltransferase [Verrucomicrobiota bacterium]
MSTGAQPPGSVRVQPATEADLELIARLAAEIWRVCYAAILAPGQIDYMLARMYSLDAMREEMQGRGIRYDLLFEGGVAGGFASYGPESAPGLFKLHKIYLRPELQGRGLGSLLLRHCEAEARRLGGRRLMLNVNKGNARAIAAYQRNGYKIAREVVADIGGGYVMDDFVMEKVLETQDSSMPTGQ